MFDMQRRTFLASAVACCSCSTHVTMGDELLPETLEGGWKRGARGAASTIPETAATLGVVDSAGATYTGASGDIQVNALRMKSETVAFEVIQRWRQADGPATYKGPVVFVAASGDREASMQLLRALAAGGVR